MKADTSGVAHSTSNKGSRIFSRVANFSVNAAVTDNCFFGANFSNPGSGMVRDSNALTAGVLGYNVATLYGSQAGTVPGYFNNIVTIAGTILKAHEVVFNAAQSNVENIIYGDQRNPDMPVFADNAAASALFAGTMYRTSTGEVRIKT